jgi:hypothetical protein
VGLEAEDRVEEAELREGGPLDDLYFIYFIFIFYISTLYVLPKSMRKCLEIKSAQYCLNFKTIKEKPVIHVHVQNEKTLPLEAPLPLQT